ncbi:fibronectin [Bacillus sp. FJAT-18019]|nr:fibronectin [Bacillus sp. FJAT-18019]
MQVFKALGQSRMMFLPLLVIMSMLMSFFPAQVSAADRGPWAPNVSYAANDTATYSGKTYKVIQPHTSLTGWEPPNVPALWQLVQGGGGADTTAPTAPANLTVSGVTSSSVTLSWQASTDNVGVTGYDVYQGSSLAASVTGLSATISGLSPSTTYSFKVVAKDAAGNLSPASSTVNATTSGTGGGGQPIGKHILTGYWQNFVNGATKLKVRDIPNQYDIIVLSFAEMDPANPGGVTFTVDSALSSALGGYTDADLIADIQAKRAQGKKVIISIGGEKGNINLNSASPNVTNFVNSMYGVITRFGLDGIDVDLEHGMNVPNLTNAIRQLKQKVGNDFVLTMAPQTIDMQNPNTTYMQLYNNLKDITTVINVQYYNSGCMLGRDGKCYSQGTVDFLTALSDLTLQWVAPSQLGIGVPATSSAAGGGYVSPTVVNNALNCLATGNSCGSYKPVAKYPDIRGAMTWSVNWDATTNYALANTVKPFLNTLP